eukprot:3629879-Alexandrium_andersonii.AAC.1
MAPRSRSTHACVCDNLLNSVSYVPPPPDRLKTASSVPAGPSCGLVSRRHDPQHYNKTTCRRHATVNAVAHCAVAPN